MRLETKVQLKIEEMTAYANKTWNLDIESSQIQVNYSLTSVNKLGTCLTKHTKDRLVSYINLNANLLNEYKEVYINEVVVHEMAHAIVGHKYPTRMNGWKRVMPHGKEFKAVCSHFGNDGKATTKLFSDSESLKSTRKPMKTFKYVCGCSEHNLSKVRHNKILKGASYTCRTCKQKLERKG